MSEPNPPSEVTPPGEVAPGQPVRKARSMLWRLALLVPAIVCAVWGYIGYSSVPPGGTVTSISLKTKSDIAGQTRDAKDAIDPGTPDLYLKLMLRDQTSVQLPVYEDTMIGSGLTWTLPTPRLLEEINSVEVWEDNTLLKNKQLDRIALDGGWSGTGQTFMITLAGTHPQPPRWALPLLAAGATLAGVVILKFVWDQAI